MRNRYETLTVRFKYNLAPTKDEHIDGFLENLLVPLKAMLLSGTDTVTLVLKRDGDMLGAEVYTVLPSDSDILANQIKDKVVKMISETFGMFPDKIEIVYEEVKDND